MDPEVAAARVDDEMIDEIMRVLIVDDEPEIRHLVANALEGYDVVEAGNGQDALRAIREQRPSLLITDIKMPDMDGWELLTAVREEVPDLPVLAISGYVDEEGIGEYDFDGFIGKPFVLQSFRDSVEGALAKGAA